MADDDEGPEFDFEAEEGLTNIAKMGLTVYRATIRDGASESEAFNVTSAFFAGFSKGTMGSEGTF